MEPTKLIRRQNLYEPKSFTPHTYSRFIKQFVDVYNYGHLIKNADGEQIKSFRFSGEDINDYWHKWGWRASATHLKLHEHIEPHLEGSETYFYTCNPYSYIAMFTIDLDAPKDKPSKPEDMEKAAQYITDNFHPGAYYETSTLGKGIHIYIFVDVSDYGKVLTTDYPLTRFNMHLVNHFINNLEHPDRKGWPYHKLLDRLIGLKGWSCKVDRIKGTYSSHQGHMDHRNYRFEEGCRGTLCKLPRPQTRDDFMKLVHTPIQSLTGFCNNSKTIEKLLVDDYGVELYADTKVKEPFKKTSSPPPSTSSKSTSAPPVSLEPTEAERFHDNDARVRTVATIQHLARKQGYIPDYDEWHKFYVGYKCNGGPENPKRRKRFKDCAEYVRQTFNPMTGGSLCYQVGEFIEDIKQRITVEQLQVIRNGDKEKISHAHMDVGMGYIWKCLRNEWDEGLEFTIPTKGMPGWFQKLKEQTGFGCNCNQQRQVFDALEKIGYIRCFDPYSRKGKSCRWEIYPNCPRYQDYCDMGLVERVKIVRRRLIPQMDPSIFWDQVLLDLEQAIATCDNESTRYLLEKQRDRIHGQWLVSLIDPAPKATGKHGKRSSIRIRRRA
jgi:hypothetical protein